MNSDQIVIAAIAVVIHAKKMKITKIDKIYAGGKRGWKGDVPIVRINSNKIRKIGWENKFSSKTSVIDAVDFLINNAKQYRFINK